MNQNWTFYLTSDAFTGFTKRCARRDVADWILSSLNLPKSVWRATLDESGEYRVHAAGEAHAEWIVYPA